MNKIQKAGLAVVAAYGMSFAAGNLWGTNDEDFLSLQVQFPDVLECWTTKGQGSMQPDPNNPGEEVWVNSDCYSETGGWFYGYAENGGSTLEAFIDGDWVNFGVSPSPQLTDAGGASKIGNAFKLRYYAGPQESATKPGLAAFGANLRKNEKAEGSDVASKGGICVVYESNAELKVELGWDEVAYNYNTFQAVLPASPTKRSIDLAWDASAAGRTSGDFSRDTWSPTFDIAMALNDLRAIKFPLKNVDAVGINAEFSLYELGWIGTCSGSPILSSPKNSNVNFSMVGRMVSMSVKEPTVVQVISLQGAVVHSQTITSASSMNLSKLPTGIYMLRAPSLGYTSRILLK